MALGGFELVDAAMARARLPVNEASVVLAQNRGLLSTVLITWTVSNARGYLCRTGPSHQSPLHAVLETVVSRDDAQLAVAVVNEALPGGWLEFLGRVELDDKMFAGSRAENRRRRR